MRKILTSSLLLLLLGVGIGNGLQQELKVERGTRERKGPFKLLNSWAGIGFVPQWLICGPFPNPGPRPNLHGWDKDYLDSAGGEGKIEPFEGMAIEYEGNNFTWVTQEIGLEHDLDFREKLDYGKADSYRNVVLYACCYLQVEEDTDVLAFIGDNHGYKLWCNHELLIWKHFFRVHGANEEKNIPLHLNKGVNVLLIKLDSDHGGFHRFYFRITNRYGEQIQEIKVWN